MLDMAYSEIMADAVQAEGFARYRADIYRLASSVFMYDVTEQGLQAQIETARNVDEGSCVRACEAELFAHLRGYDGCDLSELRTKVATEYAELFVGPRKPLAPYYESIYLGANPRLFADVTMRVREAYREQGFAVDRISHVPDDHIAYELAFMGELCEREAEAHAAKDRSSAIECQVVQCNFLAIHLGVWAGLFADRVNAAPVADYYAAWSRFVERFVADDQAFLASCAVDPVSAG